MPTRPGLSGTNSGTNFGRWSGGAMSAADRRERPSPHEPVPDDWEEEPTTLWEAWGSGLIIGLLVGGALGFLLARWLA